MACVDRVEYQVEQRLMHLVRVEFTLEAAVHRDIDRHSFIGRMGARDGSDVVQRVGELTGATCTGRGRA